MGAGSRELVIVTVGAALWGMLALRPGEPSPPAQLAPAAPQMRPLVPPERICGQVVDALTGRPVRRAVVRGWGRGLKVGKDGQFTAEAHQDVSLVVDAPYYDAQKVVLEPGRFREIRLVPATPID